MKSRRKAFCREK
uniref:Uncharacterized protein n=1 Tax=Rhizophora mucronata TaxID=61149 RepID=A0A2P2JEH4_RHIMU